MGKTFLIQPFAIGLLLGTILMGVWFLAKTPLAQPGRAAGPLTKTLDTTSTTSPVNDTGGALSVSSQSAGSSVLVESVTVPPPGVWVAVRDTSGGDLGNILGAARAGGPRSNFSVPLLRATEPGTTYAVELYRDDTDGLFDPTKDSVYVDFSSGEPVVARFTTTS